MLTRRRSTTDDDVVVALKRPCADPGTSTVEPILLSSPLSGIVSPGGVLSPERNTAAWALTALVGGLASGGGVGGASRPVSRGLHPGGGGGDDNDVDDDDDDDDDDNKGGGEDSSESLWLAPLSTSSACSSASASSTAGRDYSRRDKSLGLLCANFVALYNSYPAGTQSLSLDKAAESLGVERRR